MNRNAKLWLMFLPMGLFFAGLFAVVGDLRQPTVISDQCQVVATGSKASQMRTEDNLLYAQSTDSLNDVGFKCPKFGPVVLNDMDLFATRIEEGQQAEIVRKRYRILPTRWSVSVATGPSSPD